MTSYPHEWQVRHASALLRPTDDERPLVELVQTIKTLAERYDDDYVLREGVANLITGTRVLLNAEWGNRLDMGTIDALLVEYSDRIGFDLDVESFRDEPGY